MHALTQVPAASPRTDVDQTSDILISFYVACFNEEKSVYDTLATLSEALEPLGLAYEIIAVDDASKDSSVAEIKRFQTERPDLPVQLIARERNLGLALNFVECAFVAKGKWYRFVNGDNVETVDTLQRAFAAIGSADMVITYPARRVGFSPLRTLLSKTYTGLVNGISGHNIKYYNSPTIHLRRNVQRWHSRSRGFAFQADLITQLLDQGCSYVEVPVIATERTNGKSTALSLKNFLSVGHSLFEMATRRLRRSLLGS